VVHIIRAGHYVNPFYLHPYCPYLQAILGYLRTNCTLWHFSAHIPKQGLLERQSTFRHHFFHVSVAERIAQITPDAEQDYFWLKMTLFDWVSN
jgi:hypothetical protein